MKILIVDDNPTNLVVLKALSAKLDGNEVHTFGIPAEALAWCEANLPDLVLLDYMMPEMDGFEFLARFRALPGRDEIPVIMVTADNEPEVRYRALELGANDFLTKPVDKTEFLARMRNMLALRRSRKQLADHAAWLAEEVRKATADIVQRERGAIFLLSKVAEYRDPETGAHILRMANYSRLIGREMGFSEGDLELLFDAAPMHDIGKVGIPDHILLKPGKLNPDEWAIMKSHARLGSDAIEGAERDSHHTVEFLVLAKEIARWHHERWDGSGYPDGLKGDAIPISARLMALADVFDALINRRVYKEPMPFDQAHATIVAGRGSHFDPDVVDAFVAIFEQFKAIALRYREDAASEAAA